MLTAFTARPLVELKQRYKSRIESILAYGWSLPVSASHPFLTIIQATGFWSV
jgi:hypothetical protein